MCLAACASVPTPTPDVQPLLDEGRANLALYQWDAAIRTLTQAIDADPEQAEAYCLRALALASGPTGRDGRAAAITDYSRCLELAPSGPHADESRSALSELGAAETTAAH